MGSPLTSRAASIGGPQYGGGYPYAPSQPGSPQDGYSRSYGAAASNPMSDLVTAVGQLSTALVALGPLLAKLGANIQSTPSPSVPEPRFAVDTPSSINPRTVAVASSPTSTAQTPPSDPTTATPPTPPTPPSDLPPVPTQSPPAPTTGRDWHWLKEQGEKLFGLRNDPGDSQSIGGDHGKNSEHYRGRAIDFGDALNPRDKLNAWMKWAKSQGLDVLDEGNHIHVSLPGNGI